MEGERYAKRIAIYDKTAKLLNKAKALILENDSTITNVTDDNAVYQALLLFTKED